MWTALEQVNQVLNIFSPSLKWWRMIFFFLYLFDYYYFCIERSCLPSVQCLVLSSERMKQMSKGTSIHNYYLIFFPFERTIKKELAPFVSSFFFFFRNLKMEIKKRKCKVAVVGLLFILFDEIYWTSHLVV